MHRAEAGCRMARARREARLRPTTNQKVGRADRQPSGWYRKAHIRAVFGRLWEKKRLTKFTHASRARARWQIGGWIRRVGTGLVAHASNESRTNPILPASFEGWQQADVHEASTNWPDPGRRRTSCNVGGLIRPLSSAPAIRRSPAPPRGRSARRRSYSPDKLRRGVRRRTRPARRRARGVRRDRPIRRRASGRSG